MNKIVEGTPDNVLQAFHMLRDVLILLEEDCLSGQLDGRVGLKALTDAIKDLCRTCFEYRKSASTGEYETARMQLREMINPWTSQSWLMNRALSTPSGFPGDYAILEGFYDARPKTPVCIGTLFDEWLLNTGLVQAVRGRKDKCREILEEIVTERATDSLKIMKVSCGPCREIRESNIIKNHEKLFIYGIDRDEGALSFSTKSLLANGFRSDSFQFDKKNPFRIRSKGYLSQGDFDLVYCTGLYDFINDKALLQLFSDVSRLLNKGGRHLFSLKDSNQYNITSCEWIVNWSFYQRTEQDCRLLMEKSGLNIEKMWRDRTSVMMFFLTGTK